MGELKVRKIRSVGHVPLKDGPVTIGRSSQNVIVLPSTSVSRQHCVIEMIEGEPVLRDLKSTYGTRVNGERVTTAKLKNGDKIAIGRFELTFVDPRFPGKPDAMIDDEIDFPDESAATAYGGLAAIREDEGDELAIPLMDSDAPEPRARPQPSAQKPSRPSAAEQEAQAKERAALQRERQALQNDQRDLAVQRKALADDRAALQGERGALKRDRAVIEAASAEAKDAAQREGERQALIAQRDAIERERAELQNFEQTIAPQREELASTRAEVEAKQHELDAAKASLDAQAQVLRSERAQVEDDRTALDTAQAELVDREEALIRERDALEQAQQQMREERAALERRSGEIEREVEQRVHEKVDALRERERALDERDDELQRQASRIELRQNELEERSQSLADRAEILQRERDEWHAHNQNLEAVHAQRRAALDVRDASLQEREHEVAKLREAVAQQERDVEADRESLASERKEWKAEREALARRADEADSEAEAQRQHALRVERRHEKLQHRHESAEKQIADLEAKVAELQSSLNLAGSRGQGMAQKFEETRGALAQLCQVANRLASAQKDLREIEAQWVKSEEQAASISPNDKATLATASQLRDTLAARLEAVAAGRDAALEEVLKLTRRCESIAASATPAPVNARLTNGEAPPRKRRWFGRS